MKSALTVVAATLSLVAAQGGARAEDAGHPGMVMEMGGGTTPSDKAFLEAMQSMMKSMDVKPTGVPDHDFVTMMIPHHQGAIDMAKVELQYGKDPMLRKLATAIVKAQESEIAEMKAWLAAHGK